MYKCSSLSKLNYHLFFSLRASVTPVGHWCCDCDDCHHLPIHQPSYRKFRTRMLVPSLNAVKKEFICLHHYFYMFLINIYIFFFAYYVCIVTQTQVKRGFFFTELTHVAECNFISLSQDSFNLLNVSLTAQILVCKRLLETVHHN